MTDQPRPARSLEDQAAAVLNTVMAVLLGGAAACLFLYATAENAADIAAQWSADGTIDWIGVVAAVGWAWIGLWLGSQGVRMVWRAWARRFRK